MRYRAEVDGLRAVAVLPVILFHAGLSVSSGGFVGVDVFFVISGYLITSIIIEQLHRGTFSLLDFYARRARRILPALFFVVLCTMPLAWRWMVPGQDAGGTSQSVAAVSVSASNFLFWFHSGYFDRLAAERPLLHTWSLGVEEQFYVLFPVTCLLLWRLGTRWLVSLVVTVAIAQPDTGRVLATLGRLRRLLSVADTGLGTVGRRALRPEPVQARPAEKRGPVGTRARAHRHLHRFL